MAEKLKKIWTEKDFEDLSWFGSFIHGIYFNAEKYEITFDIDYIARWVPNDEEFQYWLSPASLTFHNVFNLSFNTKWKDCSIEMCIDEISADNPRLTPNKKLTEYDWTIKLSWPQRAGKITFESTGFTQIIRKQPILYDEQKLSFKSRPPLTF